MATTAGGTPYVESSDLVANYPAVSLALAEHIDALPQTILQVVRATDTTNRSTNSTSFVDVTGMSVSITPASASNAVLLVAIVSAYVEHSASGTSRGFVQMTDSSNNAISGAESHEISLGVSGTSDNNVQQTMTIFAYSTPATTSATTYKVRFRSNFAAGSITLENANATGQLYAIEVSA